jgi:DNA-binding MarR family transcriptional regulator
MPSNTWGSPGGPEARLGQSGRSRGGQPTIGERKLRAFQTYLELLDAAEWIRRQLRAQLESFDLTIDGFRMLEMLRREGPITTEAFCRRRQCKRQSMERLIRPLEERGWVRFEVVSLAPVDIAETQLAKRIRGKPRRGRSMGQISLTPPGAKFMRVVFPRHAKLVFAFMRALDLREQETLGRACRKLREGDVAKVLHEISLEG